LLYSTYKRLQHIHRFTASHLSNNNPVTPHYKKAKHKKWKEALLMAATYHVWGPGDFFLETSDQREAALAAQGVADKTGQPASVFMYFENRSRITHYYPKKGAAL